MNKKALNIGNPMAAMAASAAIEKSMPIIERNAPVIIQKTTVAIRNTVLILGGIGLLYFGNKWITNQRRKNVASKAGEDADIRAAMDVYTAIPAGLKKGDGSLFNPFGFINDVANQIKLIWQRTDTDRILEVSKKIKDIQKVFKTFRLLYEEDLYTLLNQILSPTDLDLFINRAGPSHTSSSTAVIPKGRVVLTTQKVNLRKTPVNTEAAKGNYTYFKDILKWTEEKIRQFTGDNIIETIEPDKFIGMTTGREVYDEAGKTVFVEIFINRNGVNNKFDTPVYAWKKALRFLDKDQITKEFGDLRNLVTRKLYRINPNKLSGTGGQAIIISTNKAAIYNENMQPVGMVDNSVILGEITGSLNTVKDIFIKFRNVQGFERYVNAVNVKKI